MSVTTTTSARHDLTVHIDQLATGGRAAANAVRDNLLAAADNDQVKVIVLHLTCGKTATDLPPSRPDRIDTDMGVHGLLQSITYCKKVVVAELVGTGHPLTSAICLSADLAVAGHEATFPSPFLEIPDANFVMAILTMRTNRAKRWALGPEPLSAEAALSHGLVNRVADSTDRVVDGITASIAAMPLDGITVSKMNLLAAFDYLGVGADFDAAEAFSWTNGAEPS